MFGIGLPELLVILALALIVVGPEKLPGLAKTIARQLVDLKKAAASLQESLKDEEVDKPWEEAFHRRQHPPGLPETDGEAAPAAGQDAIFDEVHPASGQEDASAGPDPQDDQR